MTRHDFPGQGAAQRAASEAYQRQCRNAPKDPRQAQLYWTRLKAAQCLKSGWTMEQATGRFSEYGFVRESGNARPLAGLVAAERRA